jgi:hypothetical protein
MSAVKGVRASRLAIPYAKSRGRREGTGEDPGRGGSGIPGEDSGRASVPSVRGAGRRGPQLAGGPARLGGSVPLDRRIESSPLTLREVLDRVVAVRGWQDQVEAQALVAAWPSAVGPLLAAHSLALRVVDGVLEVGVESGVWATQLGFLRREIMARYASRGLGRLRDIRFRVGPELGGAEGRR